MRELLVVQHCQSEHHINGLVGGWTNTPLTELGRSQARLVAERLRAETSGKDFRIFASDLLRAAQTAEIMAAELSVGMTLVPGIREVNNGNEAGKTREWVKLHSPPFPKQRTIDFSPSVGGETWREFYRRTAAALEEIVQTGIEHVILVTHGGTTSNILAWWLHIPVEVLATSRFQGSPGGITMLRESDSGMRYLSCFNDTHHLHPG